MSVQYSKTSPYYGTGLYSQFLDIRDNRKISKLESDRLYVIDRVYHLRPDLLANELYGDSRLWWVFAARNPNSLKDPLFSFVSGTQIFLPAKSTLVNDLGI